MMLSYLRLAAGVCVLSTGLLLGGAGGAIAVADPGSHGSVEHGPGCADKTNHGSSTAGNPPRSGTTVRKTLQGVTSALGSDGNPGPQASSGATGPKTEPRGGDTTDAKKDASLGGAVPNVVALAPIAVAPAPPAVAPAPPAVAPATNAVAQARNPGGQAPNPVTPATNGVAQAPAAIAPVTNVVAPAPNPVGSAPNPVGSAPAAATPAPTAVAPVTNVEALVLNLLAPATDAQVPGLLTPLTDVVALVPLLVAWGFDVIGAVQDILTSVAGEVASLMQLPADLLSLLGVTGAVQAAISALGGWCRIGTFTRKAKSAKIGIAHNER